MSAADGVVPAQAAERRARREAAPAPGRSADTKGDGEPGEVAVACSAVAESGRARAAVVIVTEALRAAHHPAPRNSSGGLGSTSWGAMSAKHSDRPWRASTTPHGRREPPTGPRTPAACGVRLSAGVELQGPVCEGAPSGLAALISHHPLPQAGFWKSAF